MSLRITSLERDLRWLLDDLCTQWGFCISAEACDQIVRRSSLSADEFANLVLEAEGMNPEREIEWFRRIRDRFIERFGEIGVSRRLRFGSLAGRL